MAALDFTFERREKLIRRDSLEEGIEQGKKQSALRMIEAGKFTSEEIALYSGLALGQVLELEKEL